MLEGGGGTVEDFSKAKEESHRLGKFCIGGISGDFRLFRKYQKIKPIYHSSENRPSMSDIFVFHGYRKLWWEIPPFAGIQPHHPTWIPNQVRNGLFGGFMQHEDRHGMPCSYGGV